MADPTGAGQICRFIPLPIHPTTPLFTNALRNALRSFVWLPLAALFCLSMPGCGGEETPPPHAEVTPQPAPPPVTPPPVEEKKPEEPVKEPEEEKPMEKAKPEPPKRPAEVAKWKSEHYLSAKKESDPKLASAVEWMAEKYQKNTQAAALFRQLLITEHLPGEKRADGTTGPEKDVAVTPGAAIALVKGLVLNQTPEATATLKELMYGKLETPVNPQAALNNVLAEMVQHLDYQEYEDYLFGLLTQPQKTLDGAVLVPESPITNDQLRARILGLVDAASTPQLNVRLAKYLEDPEVTKAVATDLESTLIREKPDTLLAKLLLYQNEKAERRSITSAENSLITHSETALSLLLGLPPRLEEIPPLGTISRPVARQKGLADEVVDAEMAFASKCWAPEFEGYLMDQIKKKRELTNSPGALQLIGSTPTQLARANMGELIAEHAYLGPNAWTTPGFFGRTISDPSFIIQAKNVYHNPSRRAGRGTPDRETQDRWRDAMEPLIQIWIRRFYTAARNSIPEDWQAAKETGNFKITLHRDAQVVAEYHLVWPGTAQAQVPDVPLAGLEIHYIRLEEEAVPDKIINHYKRYGASGPVAPKHTVRNGAWYDDLDNGATPKSRRSTDIFITHKPIPEEKAQAGVIPEPKPVPISIDILTIEIPDPSGK